MSGIGTMHPADGTASAFAAFAARTFEIRRHNPSETEST
jgi:hypothetical protein